MLLAMFGRRKSGIPHARLVVVNTKDLRSIVGWLTESFPDAVVLKGARALPDKAQILGDAVILRENISWIQADVPPHMMED